MTVRYRKDSQKWMVDINLPDHPRIRQLVPEAKNRSQALQAEKAIIASLFDKKYGTPKAPTLESFIQSHYLPWAKLNKKSWQDDRYHCDVLTRFFGDKILDQISPFDIERFKKLRREEMGKRKKLVTPTTVNRHLEVLSKIFSLAVRDAVVSKNPCQSVAKLKTQSRRYRILSSEEEQRLLAVLVGRRAYLLDLVQLDLATGLRKGELLSLRWEQVNLSARILTIKNTKTGRDRFVPLTDRAIEALSRLMRKTNSLFVFPSPVIPETHITEIKKAWASALQEAQIADFRFHDLRHTFVTRSIGAGIPAAELLKGTGHGSLAMLDRYVNPSNTSEKIADALDGWRQQQAGEFSLTSDFVN